MPGRAYEALADLSDEQLDRPIEAAHGWSGRDLMAHMLAWQGVSLDAAKELAVGETSATIARVDADWETRGGEVVNDEITRTWAAIPMAELRERFRTQPGELRGYLTVVPEARWVKHAAASQVVPRRDDRPLRRSRRRPRRDPRRRRRMTLREILDASATETPDVEAGTDDDGATTWSYGGTVFALLSPDGATATFLLDPIVANAAARTPDVKRSRRGEGWVDWHRRSSIGMSTTAPERGSCRGIGGWPDPASSRIAPCPSVPDGPGQARGGRKAAPVRRPGPLGSLGTGRLGYSVVAAAANSVRPNCCSSCSSGRNPTTPCGCAPGLKNAIVGMLMMLNAWESRGLASTSTLTTSTAPSYFSASFSISGRDHLAGPAPCGPEVDDDRSLRLEHELLEGRVGRVLDLRHVSFSPLAGGRVPHRWA